MNSQFQHHGEKGEQHLTVEDLARREGVPVQTVYGWNKTGTGPRFMKIGRYARYGWPT